MRPSALLPAWQSRTRPSWSNRSASGHTRPKMTSMARSRRTRSRGCRRGLPGLHVIMAVLPPGNYDEVGRVVPHEISHQVLHQATDNPFSRPLQWLNEGLAVYWQETGRDRFYSYALELASSGEVPPLRTLNGSFLYERDGARYAFSLTAVMYILDTWGDEGMSKLLATVEEGVTHDDAIEQGLGITFDELDRRWREDLLADAQQVGATGATRFGDDDGASPGRRSARVSRSRQGRSSWVSSSWSP